MKNLSVKWLFLFLLFSIITSVYISTSINFQDDGLRALLNVFLPSLLGLVSVLFVITILLFVKDLGFRKMTMVICIISNLILGVSLKLNYFSKSDVTKTYSLISRHPPKNNIHLVSNTGNTNYKAAITFDGTDSFSTENRLYFSRLSNKGRKIVSQNPKVKVIIEDHDVVPVQIGNDSEKDLIITGADFLKGGLWKIVKIGNQNVDNSVFPVLIGAHKVVNITLAFTADDLEARTKRFGWNILFKFQLSLLHSIKWTGYQPAYLSNCIPVNDVLVLFSNSTIVKKINLNGLWQYRAEGDWEPDLQKILNNLDFKTNTGFRYFDNGSNGDFIIPNSDEIAVSYFERANNNAGVKIIQLAAYHAFNSTREDGELKAFFKGDKRTIALFKNEPGAAQVILPKTVTADGANFVSFYPDKTFGFVMGTSNTDRTKNFGTKIGIRVWKAIDLKGEIINDAYILGCDFIGQPRTNYDYQDNVYLVQNVKPVFSEPQKLIGFVKK